MVKPTIRLKLNYISRDGHKSNGFRNDLVNLSRGETHHAPCGPYKEESNIEKERKEKRRHYRGKGDYKMMVTARNFHAVS